MVRLTGVTTAKCKLSSFELICSPSPPVGPTGLVELRGCFIAMNNSLSSVSRKLKNKLWMLSMLALCHFPATLATDFHRFWPDNLYAVNFVDKNTGFIAGYSGTLLRTTDGGDNWEALYMGRNELIRRVDFVDPNYGWAVGHRGSIFHSKDGGRNWEIQHSVPNTFLRDVAFVDRNHGWVVGHESTILHTVDGGITWTAQTLDGYVGRDLPRLHGIVVRSASEAALVGEFGVIAHTQDGGEHWSLVANESRGTLLSIAAVGDRYVTVGSDGVINLVSPVVSLSTSAVAEGLAAVVGSAQTAAAGPAGQTASPHVIEYQIQALATGTSEHFFAVSAAGNGVAVAVGRSAVVKIDGTAVSPLVADDSVALPFSWFGGVAVLEDGSFWLAGIRGAVARGDLASGSLTLAFNLATFDRVVLSSSRWETSQ